MVESSLQPETHHKVPCETPGGLQTPGIHLPTGPERGILSLLPGLMAQEAFSAGDQDTGKPGRAVLGVEEEEAPDIGIYHCPNYEKTHVKSTCRPSVLCFHLLIWPPLLRPVTWPPHSITRSEEEWSGHFIEPREKQVTHCEQFKQK
ncbi:uncharacterized protein [Gorilla gorilla gorilla]|uniref:uncharacterized protein isoform X2 n=1 Tax=Gorilla gorilla gorilla TaxID=9595 RepID=UPI003008B85C